MAAAATAGYNGGNDAIVTSISRVEAPKPKVQEMKSERGLDHHQKSKTLPLKKRSKIIDAARTNNYSNHNKRSFPRDEEEGAILLMALSCGLACSS